MSAEQSAQDPSPSTPVKRGKLITRNVTGLARWPATGKHRVVNSCRAGHEETIEVHTQADLIEAAMIAACLVCGGLVVISRHIGADGREIGMVLVLDDQTPPDSPGVAR